MLTSAQLAANQANAQLSTGPRTEAGKLATAKNSITFGLFSGDFVRPEESDIHATHVTAIHEQLEPSGPLEEILADEIQRAAWRLRRCNQVETNLLRRNDSPETQTAILDPMEDPDDFAGKVQRSVDRARGQSLRNFHKCAAELRHLQAERHAKGAVTESVTQSVSAPDSTNAKQTQKAKQTQTRPLESGGNTRDIGRNAPCPCNSGLKFKRCCANRPAMPKAA